MKDQIREPQTTIRQLKDPTFWLKCLICLLGTASIAQAQAPQSYNSPEDAMKDLVAAAQAQDRGAIRRIFGADVKRLVSGDVVQEEAELNSFAKRASEKAELLNESATSATIIFGNEEWPFPVPLIKSGEQWSFDTTKGVDEILRRRIGRNELTAIALCASYSVAQWDYFLDGDWNNDGVQEFAQKLISSPGQKDGLYWPADISGGVSPFGPLADVVREQGYVARGATNNVQPFHGYIVKLLKAQGPAAPGGAHSYVINGRMISGFALVAYPSVYGQSGVMTFIVNQQGKVFQNNLGPNTVQLARAMTAYNPGAGWTPVNYQEALDTITAVK
jgi:hypothetical protein